VTKAILGGFHAAKCRILPKEMSKNCKLTDKFDMNVKSFAQLLRQLFDAYPDLLNHVKVNDDDNC
jgi:hypothetical protein